MNLADEPTHLFWLDLETTGLDPQKDEILEVSWLFTYFRHPYAPIERSSYLVRHDMAYVAALVSAEPKVFQMHTQNGLLRELKEYAAKAHPIETIEHMLLDISKDWEIGRVRLAGFNPHFDRHFLERHMPTFWKRLPHRVFDVRSLIVACQSLGMPEAYAFRNAPERRPENEHRAGPDVEAARHSAIVTARWTQSLAALMRPVPKDE